MQTVSQVPAKNRISSFLESVRIAFDKLHRIQYDAPWKHCGTMR